MITSQVISTTRLKQHVLLSGSHQGEVVLFVHGNASSSIFWKETMKALPSKYYAIAPDLRGYGDTEDLIIDATRGFGDFVDDLLSLLDTLKIEKCHLVGHSLGGGIIFSLMAQASARFKSATLVNPASPYGFGGTKDLEGSPCCSDFAGSGGGTVNPEFARLMKEKNRGSDNPQASPRVVMNSFYWKPPFIAPNEEELLDSLLSEKVGEDRYPGDFTPSDNYPFVAPGKFGPINASSPKYIGDTVAQFIHQSNPCPILWVRGSHDLIVSDQSFFEFGTLGKLGLIPNYPGEKVYPPQPMVGQTRSVLEKYQKKGGRYTEVVIEETGHTPFIEKPEEFNKHFHNFLKSVE